MNDKNFDKCKVLIDRYFKSLNSKKSKFIPGKSNIPLAIPPYGSDEVIESLESLMSTNVTGGEKVSKFEKKFSKYVGTKYGIMVNSGSSANLLALSILSHPSLKNRIVPFFKPNIKFGIHFVERFNFFYAVHYHLPLFKRRLIRIEKNIALGWMSASSC